MDYKKMYFELFNKLTDIIEELKELQCKMEEIHINADSDESKE